MASKKPGVLDRLTAAGKPVSKETFPKSKPKQTIVLIDSEADLLDRVAGADAVLKVAAAGQTETKAKVIEFLRATFLRMCVEHKRIQENPAVVSSQSNGNLQVKHVSGVRTERGPSGDPISIADQLRGAGFAEDVVQEIVDKAISEKPSLRVRSLTELAASDNPTEKRVAKKIAGLIENGLTAAEQSVLLQHVVEVSVDECWKELAVAIAVRVGEGDVEKGIEALGKLWGVLPVQFVLAQLSFGGEVSEAFGKLLQAG